VVWWPAMPSTPSPTQHINTKPIFSEMANIALSLLFLIAVISGTAHSRSVQGIAGVDAAAAPTAPLAPHPTNVTTNARADPQLIYPSLYYGNYCGPGTLDFTNAKIDDLDVCCEKHDRCFDGNHLSCDMMSCNLALSQCASAVRAKCSWAEVLLTSSKCLATTNVVGYANWEVYITCPTPYKSVYYKTDEDLERESCATSTLVDDVKTRLSNGCKGYNQPIATPTPSAPRPITPAPSTPTPSTPTPSTPSSRDSVGVLGSSCWSTPFCTFRISMQNVAMAYEAATCSGEARMDTISGSVDQLWIFDPTEVGLKIVYRIKSRACDNRFLTAGKSSAGSTVSIERLSGSSINDRTSTSEMWRVERTGSGFKLSNVWLEQSDAAFLSVTAVPGSKPNIASGGTVFTLSNTPITSTPITPTPITPTPITPIPIKPTPSTPSASNVSVGNGLFRISTGRVAMEHDNKRCSSKLRMNMTSGASDQLWEFEYAWPNAKNVYKIYTPGCVSAGGRVDYLTAENSTVSLVHGSNVNKSAQMWIMWRLERYGSGYTLRNLQLERRSVSSYLSTAAVRGSKPKLSARGTVFKLHKRQ
jgi:hypothetical protein